MSTVTRTTPARGPQRLFTLVNGAKALGMVVGAGYAFVSLFALALGATPLENMDPVQWSWLVTMLLPVAGAVIGLVRPVVGGVLFIAGAVAWAAPFILVDPRNVDAGTLLPSIAQFAGPALLSGAFLIVASRRERRRASAA